MTKKISKLTRELKEACKQLKKLGENRNKWREDYRKAQNKLNTRNFTMIVLVLAFIGTLLIIPNVGKNVNEDMFCYNKMTENFPEYNFERPLILDGSGFDGYDICKGYYETEENKSITRDGLKEVVPKKTKYKEFELINEEEIDYLYSDEVPNLLIGIGVFLLILAVVFLVVTIMDYKR